MRHGAKDLLPAIAERQLLQQRFEAGLILHVENILQLDHLFRRQFHAIDNSAEEIDAAQIDLKFLNAETLKRFNGDQQNLNVGRLACAAIVLNADLRELALPPTFWFFEPQYF